MQKLKLCSGPMIAVIITSLFCFPYFYERFVTMIIPYTQMDVFVGFGAIGLVVACFLFMGYIVFIQEN